MLQKDTGHGHHEDCKVHWSQRGEGEMVVMALAAAWWAPGLLLFKLLFNLFLILQGVFKVLLFGEGGGTVSVGAHSVSPACSPRTTASGWYL